MPPTQPGPVGRRLGVIEDTGVGEDTGLGAAALLLHQAWARGSVRTPAPRAEGGGRRAKGEGQRAKGGGQAAPGDEALQPPRAGARLRRSVCTAERSLRSLWAPPPSAAWFRTLFWMGSKGTLGRGVRRGCGEGAPETRECWEPRPAGTRGPAPRLLCLTLPCGCKSVFF